MLTLLKTFFISSVIIFSSNSALVGAASENEVEISVSPAIIEVAANPGDTIERSISIRNSSEQPLPITIEINSLLNYDGVKDSQYLLSDSSSWIDVDTSSIIAEPNSVKNLNLTFTIPDKASAGGHYAQINLRALTLQKDSSQRTSLVIPEVVASVLMNISGDIKESYEFDSKNVFPMFITPNNFEKLSFSVKNTGNTHGLITPTLVLTNKAGEEKRIQLSSELLLPGSTKVFSEPWQSPGEYGLYTAHLESTVANSGEKITSDGESVLVMRSAPQTILLGLISLIGVYLFDNRKNIRRALKILLKV
jgi:hypothetical protein